VVRRDQLFPTACILFSICFAAPARADVITVTAGEAVVPWDDPSHFMLSGVDGFALGGLFVRVPTSPQGICFRGCAPGTSVDFSAVFGGTSSGSVGSATAATIEGINYLPRIYLTGTLVFDAPTVTLPGAEYDGDAPPTAPFVFRGHVAGFNANDLEMFQLDLTGRGTVTVAFLPVSPGSPDFTNFSATYGFASPDPIPEPTSIFLLGTGLAGLVARRRRSMHA
jgi:hypothetical protein